MRVAIDIRPLQTASGPRGVGRYIRSLLAHLPAEGADYLLMESRWRAPSVLAEAGRQAAARGDAGPSPGRGGREGAPAAPGRSRNAAEAGHRMRLWRPPRAITLFDQLATPLFLASRRADLFHSTFYALPSFRTGRARAVLTVHDLIPLIVPRAVGAKNRAIFARIYRSSLRSDAVIVPSGRTAADLSRLIGVPAERVRVIPMGVGPPFCAEATAVETARAGDGAACGSASDGRESVDAGPGASPTPLDRLRRKGRRVLLYAGGFDTSKNVPFLIDALGALNEPDAVLCMAGDPGPELAGLRARAVERGLGEQVHFLGRLSDDELAASYRRADLFVSASLYEGFGLPALEAMACGCPVVALSCGTVPEVLEGAAIGIEGTDAVRFAEAVREVLGDAALRKSLVHRGSERARLLSWQRAAQQTMDLYRELGAP